MCKYITRMKSAREFTGQTAHSFATLKWLCKVNRHRGEAESWILFLLERDMRRSHSAMSWMCFEGSYFKLSCWEKKLRRWGHHPKQDDVHQRVLIKLMSGITDSLWCANNCLQFLKEYLIANVTPAFKEVEQKHWEV